MMSHKRSLGGDQELSNVYRFHDVGVRAQLQTLEGRLNVGRARQYDHGHLGVDGPNLAEELDSGHARHIEFGQDERRPPGLEDLEPLVAVAGHLAVVAGAEEDLVQNLANLAVPHDEQDFALGHGQPNPLRASEPGFPIWTMVASLSAC